MSKRKDTAAPDHERIIDDCIRRLSRKCKGPIPIAWRMYFLECARRQELIWGLRSWRKPPGRKREWEPELTAWVVSVIDTQRQTLRAQGGNPTYRDAIRSCIHAGLLGSYWQKLRNDQAEKKVDAVARRLSEWRRSATAQRSVRKPTAK